MTPTERYEIERACARLPVLFARHADNGDHAALASLFTEECEFSHPFQPQYPFYGRDRVHAIFRDRPAQLVRHIVSNVLVDVVSGTQATGSNYLTMLSSHLSLHPPQEAGGIYVGGFEDRYAFEDGAWRFAWRAGSVSLYQGGQMPNLNPPSEEARGL